MTAEDECFRLSFKTVVKCYETIRRLFYIMHYASGEQNIFLRKVKKALKFMVIRWEVFLFQGRQGRLKEENH